MPPRHSVQGSGNDARLQRSTWKPRCGQWLWEGRSRLPSRGDQPCAGAVPVIYKCVPGSLTPSQWVTYISVDLEMKKVRLKAALHDLHEVTCCGSGQVETRPRSVQPQISLISLRGQGGVLGLLQQPMRRARRSGSGPGQTDSTVGQRSGDRGRDGHTS